MKYRTATIRKAPETVRPLMKIANEMDKQLNRLTKQIRDQIELAILMKEQESTIQLQETQLRNTDKEPDTTPQTFSDLPWEQGVDEGLEDMPSFNQRISSGNKGCGCMALSDEEAKNYIVPHRAGCTRDSHEVISSH